MPERPIIVFDVNETLLDLDTIRPVFDRIFNDPAARRLWFANLITYSEALTLAGVYVRSPTSAVPCSGCSPPPAISRSVTPTLPNSPAGSPTS